MWGIDLGSGAAMSALAAYFPSGRLEAVAAFPELPSLAKRGLADGVGSQYQKMAGRGELITAGRRVADVRALLSEGLARFGRPVALVADRWREAELRDALEALRFPQAALVTRGMGYKDGSEDVRAFRRAFLEGRVTPVPSLLLTAAMGRLGRWPIRRGTRNCQRQPRGVAGGGLKTTRRRLRYWQSLPVTGSGRRGSPVGVGRRWSGELLSADSESWSGS